VHYDIQKYWKIFLTNSNRKNIRFKCIHLIYTFLEDRLCYRFVGRRDSNCMNPCKSSIFYMPGTTRSIFHILQVWKTLSMFYFYRPGTIRSIFHVLQAWNSSFHIPYSAGLKQFVSFSIFYMPGTTLSIFHILQA